MRGIQAAAYKHGLPLLAAGFGTAFALHFTQRSELRDYRDVLEDDPKLLQRCLLESLGKGSSWCRMAACTYLLRIPRKTRTNYLRHGPGFQPAQGGCQYTSR
jgi:glutamate-1-semialdehyde aminotransferase